MRVTGNPLGENGNLPQWISTRTPAVRTHHSTAGTTFPARLTVNIDEVARPTTPRAPSPFAMAHLARLGAGRRCRPRLVSPRLTSVHAAVVGRVQSPIVDDVFGTPTGWAPRETVHAIRASTGHERLLRIFWRRRLSDLPVATLSHPPPKTLAVPMRSARLRIPSLCDEPMHELVSRYSPDLRCVVVRLLDAERSTHGNVP